MLTNAQLIFAIRTIYPQIAAADHGRKYWVLSTMDGDTQASTAEIYKWNFPNLVQPTPQQILAIWAARSSELSTVPTSCTRKQGNLALLQLGRLDQILTLVAAAQRKVKIAFDEAATFERTDPNLISLANAAGMSSADLDALFTLAVTL